MQHTTLWYPYTIRFIFRYAVMLILVFFKDLHIFFSYFIRITVTLSCICFLNCSHLYKQQLKLNSELKTQIKYQKSEISNRNQKSNSNCLQQYIRGSL